MKQTGTLRPNLFFLWCFKYFKMTFCLVGTDFIGWQQGLFGQDHVLYRVGR